MATIEADVALDQPLEQAKVLKKEPQGDSYARQQLNRLDEVYQIPRSIFSEDKEAKLIRFLENEFRLAESERMPMIQKFARWKVVYAAPAADESKHWPIWNASNLTIPVVKEMVNTLAAQIVMQTLTARPRYNLKELAKEWEPFMDELERFMDVASDRDLRLDEAAIPAVLEAAKMGTSIMSVENLVDVRNQYAYTADGRGVYKRRQIRHDGPRSYHIPISRCWFRAHFRDIQDMQWFATEHDFTWAELKERAFQKKLSGVAELKKWAWNTWLNEAERQENKLEEWEPSDFRTFQLFKAYVSWDIDGDGDQEELVLWWSKDANAICSRQFAYYWHGKRPFVKIGYFPRENTFWDEGLCEMLEDLQAGISDKHNKRADNAALANLKMILKRKMVQGLMPGDPLYMGKIIEVNDIWNDIREWQLAEIYPSTVAEEQIMRQYAERLAGSNEATAGAAMPVTRTTMGAQIALLNEQAKRIDLTVRSVRAGLNEVGALATGIYHQFGTNGKALAWLGEKGRLVEAIFRLPRRVQEIGLALQASVPTSQANRQIKAQSSLQQLQLITQVYEKLWPFAQALAPEHIAEVAHGFVHSARRFLEDFLETSDTTDVDDLLAGLVVLEKVLPAPEDFGGMESYNRGAESGALFDKLNRLENLLVEAEASRSGRDGLSAGSGNGRRMAREERIPRGGGPGMRFGGPPPEG